MTTAPDQTTTPPTLPMTMSEAAAYWNVSKTTVKRWVKQNRVKSERRGGGGTRAATVLIWQLERPDRVAPGTLSEDQRRAWNKGKRGKAPAEAR